MTNTKVMKSSRPMKPLRMSDDRLFILLATTLDDVYRQDIEPIARATAECGAPVNDHFRVHARTVQRVLLSSRVLARPRWC